MKSLPCFWICYFLTRSSVSSYPLVSRSEIGIEVQIVSKSNFQIVQTFQPIGHVKVNNVGRRQAQTYGYIEIGDPREHCGKMKKYDSGSIAILIAGVDVCTFEEQLLYADRAQYNIIIAPFGKGQRIPFLSEDTQFQFVSTVALVTFKDALALLEYTREASDRYFITIHRRELKPTLPVVREEPAPNSRKGVSNAYDSPNTENSNIFAAIIIIPIAVVIMTLTIFVVVKNSRKHIARPRPQYQSQRTLGANGTTGAPLIPQEVILPQDDDDLIDTTYCQKVLVESKEYILVTLLGKGGFGSVWKARVNESTESEEKPLQHKYVVIKKIEFNPDEEQKIYNEDNKESNANENLDDPKMALQSLMAQLLEVSTNTRIARELKLQAQIQFQQLVQNIHKKCIRDSFNREVQILQRLKRVECEKFVIQMIGSVVNESESYGLILLELGGQDLQTYFSKTQCGIQNFLEIWIKMIQAVKCVHDFRIAHLDIKPANFIWVQNRQYLKLIDFGNSYIIDSEEEDKVSVYEDDSSEDSPKQPKQKQIIGGTPGLISPEVVLSTEIGTAADIWSLGCILHIMLQNEPLYAIMKLDEQTPAVQIPLMQSAVDRIQSEIFCLKNDFGGNIEVSRSLARLIKGCIQFEPSTRFTASQLLQQSEIVLSMINQAEATVRAEVEDVMRMIRRIGAQNRYRPRAYGANYLGGVANVLDGGVNILGSF